MTLPQPAVAIAILVLAAGVALLARRGIVRIAGRPRTRVLRVVDSVALTPAASLHVVHVGDRAMLVGVTTAGPLVLRGLGGRVQSETRAPPKPPVVRVFIIEPAAVMRMIAATMLRAGGIEVAGDAASVDDVTASERPATDVVLVDVTLLAAGDNRRDALARAFAHAPIVVSGYRSQRALVEAALASGARAYVAKPFAPQRLAEILRNCASNPEDVRERAPNTGG